MSADSDVVIVGAGAVGSALATALAVRGLNVAVIDGTDADSRTGETIRTSALTNASCRWLSHHGLWPAPDVETAALSALQILDGDGRGRLRFEGRDLDSGHLGVIVRHGAFEAHLRARARKTVARWFQETAQGIRIDAAGAQVTVAGGQTLKAPLLIAADGARSTLREQLGVPVWQHHYGQMAITADMELGVAHEGVAWQRFLASGPIALLPLAGAQRASLIWSTARADAERLLSLPDADFDAAVNAAFGSELGRLAVASARAGFPLTAAHAHRYVGSRFALIGDAAHRVHPLAGQGVNLGLADAGTLAHNLIAARHQGRDLGALRVLRPYERARKGDNLAMLAVTHLLNRAFPASGPWQRLLAVGLNVTDTLTPLKTLLMRQAGSLGDDPL